MPIIQLWAILYIVLLAYYLWFMYFNFYCVNYIHMFAYTFCLSLSKDTKVLKCTTSNDFCCIMYLKFDYHFDYLSVFFQIALKIN